MAAKMLHLNIIIVILIIVGGTMSSLSTDEAHAVDYLKKFGYIDNSHDSSCNFDKTILEKALKMFQSVAGVSETGLLDEDTINRMNHYRCGIRDFGSIDVPDKDIAPFTWGSKNLTFAITEYPSYLRSDAVDTIIMKAFAFMSENVDIIFTHVLYEPDIEIKFVKSIAQSVYTSFKEGSRVTAVSSVPGLLGKIYFNDEIEWSVKNDNEFSLFRSAVHQIGHILGLGHDNFTSILSPFVGIQETFNELKNSDVAFSILQTFYGSRDSTSNGMKNSLCGAGYIDTIYRTKNYQYLYVFVDKYYWKMDSSRKQIETPKLISEKWGELVGPIDAGYQDENGWTYIFVGPHFWKYYGSLLQEDYPKKIAEVFPNGPSAVFSVVQDGNQLLLKNREYTYIYMKDNSVRTGYKYISQYQQTAIFDTALYSRNTSSIYIFQNDKYDVITKDKLKNNGYYGAQTFRYELSEFFKCGDQSIANLKGFF